jgi:hypothetical protein
MFNETHRAPPRYKISDFFSSLLCDEKEFQRFFEKLAHLEGEFITQSLDSAKTWVA